MCIRDRSSPVTPDKDFFPSPSSSHPLISSPPQQEGDAIKYLARINHIKLGIDSVIKQLTTRAVDTTTSLPRNKPKEMKWFCIPYLGRFSSKLARTLGPHCQLGLRFTAYCPCPIGPILADEKFSSKNVRIHCSIAENDVFSRPCLGRTNWSRTVPYKKCSVRSKTPFPKMKRAV